MMEYGWTLLIQTVITVVTVLLVMTGFWFAVIKPFLNEKVDQIMEIAEQIEPRVRRGVRYGIEDTLRELPENTIRESTKQFRKFGSGLVENGLSGLFGEGYREKSNDVP